MQNVGVGLLYLLVMAREVGRLQQLLPLLAVRKKRLRNGMQVVIMGASIDTYILRMYLTHPHTNRFSFTHTTTHETHFTYRHYSIFHNNFNDEGSVLVSPADTVQIECVTNCQTNHRQIDM